MSGSAIRVFIREVLGREISDSLEQYLNQPFDDRWQNMSREIYDGLKEELMPIARALGNQPDRRIEVAVIDVAEMTLMAIGERRFPREKA